MNLSPEGLKLLLDYEVGGGESYFRKFLSRPTWPGESSGVTIGVGFDLGYNSQAQFSEAWGAILSDETFAILGQSLGLKGATAREWLHEKPEARAIEITWVQALSVFTNITIPRFFVQLLRVYPQANDLPEGARDALLSLVFNRGTSLTGDRRSEMVGIQNALKFNRLREVPDLLRSMKRLWPNTLGLQKRRDAEAELFAKSLV
jgi:hypothetical protein